jgi:hypothetical protein
VSLETIYYKRFLTCLESDNKYKAPKLLHCAHVSCPIVIAVNTTNKSGNIFSEDKKQMLVYICYLFNTSIDSATCFDL